MICLKKTSLSYFVIIQTFRLLSAQGAHLLDSWANAAPAVPRGKAADAVRMRRLCGENLLRQILLDLGLIVVLSGVSDLGVSGDD